MSHVCIVKPAFRPMIGEISPLRKQSRFFFGWTLGRFCDQLRPVGTTQVPPPEAGSSLFLYAYPGLRCAPSWANCDAALRALSFCPSAAMLLNEESDPAHRVH